ncbi:nuclear transport factor 2 family protein [Dactylosporangium sp. AC04546]|uniref:nuclear transport factor 2 family protein n=1 Tax=Dactylosporangium sp. AC04546 TaxID=2862460 RepID=UPI001EDF4124|nr:nuclear transport factor 2 family protein [Dactylosporangium sp. AC04546]WVK78600.1 nuclear transport factor 2 family protein [Dactylosporangium sp. AC04546]
MSAHKVFGRRNVCLARSAACPDAVILYVVRVSSWCQRGRDGTGRGVGIEAIRSAVQDQWRTFPIMQHATANHLVDIAGATAKGRCDAVILVQLPDRRWVAGGGSYEDDYRNIDGSWRIAYRRVVGPFDLAPLAPADGPGEVDAIPD